MASSEFPSFGDRFVSFIDVVGFRSMVEAAESNKGRSLSDIQNILSELAREKDKDFYKTYGPQICPGSKHFAVGLDFQISQVSDCAIVSCEASPAGIINLSHHCWAVAFKLLTMGVLVRGYITRGSMYHDGMKFVGSGYHRAYDQESEVRVFRKDADERGTPFVEIDPSVNDYIESSTDRCVGEMFSRLIKRDGELIALFPFKALSH